MADVRDVAKYFLMMAASSEEDAGENITHLKLQKLLYYGQGFFLAVTAGTPLFQAPIQAWREGPVVRQVWDIYKDYKASPIQADDEFDPSKCMNIDEAGLLGDVWNAYGQFSAWKLRNMTHQEPPWREAYAMGENTTISLERLRSYFETQIED